MQFRFIDWFDSKQRAAKEKEVAAFLDAGLPLVQDEPETTAAKLPI